jgi:hypothetical protein
MLILPETTPDEGFLQFSGVYLKANLLGFPGYLARLADSAGKELLSYSHALTGFARFLLLLSTLTGLATLSKDAH